MTVDNLLSHGEKLQNFLTENGNGVAKWK